MTCERAKAVVRGAVQGVGFRPFVYRLAIEFGLKGWVQNSSHGVLIEVEGERKTLNEFLLRLEKEKPPHARVQGLEFSFLHFVGYDEFTIRESDEGGEKTALILPDIATCADCLREILDPQNRRHFYPFTNCTNCGPRFSIVEALPYDRSNTSMRKFLMCPECDREYHDPRDRRFHAQPNACPQCGPQLELWDAAGHVLSKADAALRAAAEVVRAGQILALKGIGGFQLLVEARNENAVLRLRERKRREEKPFAVMYPTLETVAHDCRVSELEERLLLSPEAPIVLLERQSALVPSVAPRNPYLGVMLPCSPLHHLLLRELGFPVVATSGNLSDEPICIDEHEALERLQNIAEAFLVHGRPIIRHLDDSVVRVVCGREQVLRRARGYAPLPVTLPEALPDILAVGAHLKNTVAMSVGTNVFISQHIGDLETPQAHAAFRRAAADLPRLYEATPELVACDLHPDYLSTEHAAQMSAHRQAVQHHWAHVAACMAENALDPPALGVAWDGTGLGTDGTIWGGEFLLAEKGTFRRVAHLRPFRLPGGDAASKQPRRAALGVLHEIGPTEALANCPLAPMQNFSESALRLLQQTLARGLNAPLTSSAGRLFDAVASLIGLRQRASFEGQTAMELEFAIQSGVAEAYPFRVQDGSPRVVDWQPMILEIIADVTRKETLGVIAAKFHNALAEMIVAIAQRVGEPQVVLTGGCFQNKYLTERTVSRLREEDFQPHWHRRVPPNDGGITLGQVIAAAWAHRAKGETNSPASPTPAASAAIF